MPLVTDAQPEEIRLPDWGVFKLGMLSNAAYLRIAEATAAQRAVSRVEAFFASDQDNWPVAAMLWQQMLSGCDAEHLPTPAEVEGWRQIAAAANMPIQFSNLGYLAPVFDENNGE